jgi:hypothetical protein
MVRVSQRPKEGELEQRLQVRYEERGSDANRDEVLNIKERQVWHAVCMLLSMLLVCCCPCCWYVAVLSSQSSTKKHGQLFTNSFHELLSRTPFTNFGH